MLTLCAQRTVRDTFRLNDVPREVLYLGIAGLAPYVVTTASTLYLAWDLNYAHINGIGYLVNRETAEWMLHFLEPLQIGYGAVIISFLGAIHWGLEFAGYGGRKSSRRYAIGLIAPALAWPTVCSPSWYEESYYSIADCLHALNRSCYHCMKLFSHSLSALRDCISLILPPRQPVWVRLGKSLL